MSGQSYNLSLFILRGDLFQMFLLELSVCTRAEGTDLLDMVRSMTGITQSNLLHCLLLCCVYLCQCDMKCVTKSGQ